MSLTMELSLVSAHGASDEYPGTLSIQMVCANVWKVTRKVRAMVVRERGFRRYCIAVVLLDGISEC
jgi:hypothetical protein